MEYPTYADLKTRVENEMDLLDEDFVSATELLSYFNRAVDQAEANIHGICEDYFLTRSLLTMTQGSASVTLPTNIFNNRIRSLIYKNGSNIYEIEPLYGDHAFLEDELRNYSTGTSEDYRYLIKNDSAAAQPVLYLSPASRETASDRLVCWYIRNANKFTGVTTDPCDIPEFSDYVVEYVKVLCAEKEKDFETAANLKQNLIKLENDMLVTLNARVKVGAGKIQPDTSWYMEHA